jgi:hypothetical protein
MFIAVIYKSLPVLRERNLVHILPHYFLKVYFKFILLSTPIRPSGPSNTVNLFLLLGVRDQVSHSYRTRVYREDESSGMLRRVVS